MRKSPNFVNQAFTTAFLVIGIVAVSAVVFRYSGNIEIKLGADGIQLQVTGHDNVKHLK